MGISKYILPPPLYRIRKRRSSIRRQKRVADAWNPIIDEYFEGKINGFQLKAKKVFNEDEKIIWQYWAQGTDSESVPEIVRICFESVDKFKGNYRVIRLSDDTISEYVDLPDFILWKKNNHPEFTITFFSDLLRIVLLHVYGGIWMDATILLTDSLPQKYSEMEYFLFQRSEDEKHKKYWMKADPFYFNWQPEFKVNILSSIIFARKSSKVIQTLLDIMLLFWEKSEKLSYYFTMHVIYHEIITRKIPELKCVEVNDCTPHIIQSKLRRGYPYATFMQAVELTGIHKMTYYEEVELNELKEFLKDLRANR